jgi:hypothetical protein
MEGKVVRVVSDACNSLRWKVEQDGVTLLENSEASPVCPSEKSSTEMDINLHDWWIEKDKNLHDWWNDTDSRKEKTREKPVPMPLFPLQVLRKRYRG